MAVLDAAGNLGGDGQGNVIVQDGLVGQVRIVSEKGRDCTVQNPWPGRQVNLVRNGKKAEAVRGDRFTLKTAVSEIIDLSPDVTGGKR